MTINEKIEKKYFDHIAAGDTRDRRLADRVVHKGDTVILEEWDHDAQEYTGRKIETVVTGVSSLPTADRAMQENDEEELQLIPFEPKESKFTPAS